MYRQLRGLGASGTSYCPTGYTFDGAECQPNSYDCITSSGKRGKSDGQGGCTYITQPSPLVYYPPQTSCPAGQVPTKGSPTGCAVEVWGQPCKDPWGNVGIFNVSGGCEAIPAPKNVPVQTHPPAPVPEKTKAERDAECRASNGPNSAAYFENGSWQCGVCRADEVLDPASQTCVCGAGKVRKDPNDWWSACVPKQVTPVPPPVNPVQPQQPPPAQAGIGKAIFVGAVVLAVFGIGSALMGSRKEGEK